MEISSSDWLYCLLRAELTKTSLLRSKKLRQIGELIYF